MYWLLCILAYISEGTFDKDAARGVLHPFEEEILISMSIFMMLVASKQHILYLKRKSCLQ